MACGNMSNAGPGFVLEFYFDGESAGQITNRNLYCGNDQLVSYLSDLLDILR